MKKYMWIIRYKNISIYMYMYIDYKIQRYVKYKYVR